MLPHGQIGDIAAVMAHINKIGRELNKEFWHREGHLCASPTSMLAARRIKNPESTKEQISIQRDPLGDHPQARVSKGGPVCFRCQPL